MATDIKIQVTTKGLSAKLKRVKGMASQYNSDIKKLMDIGFTVAKNQAEFSRDTGQLIAGIMTRDKKEGKTIERFEIISKTPIPNSPYRKRGVKYNVLINRGQVSEMWGTSPKNKNYPNSRRSIGFMETARRYVRHGAEMINKKYRSKIIAI